MGAIQVAVGRFDGHELMLVFQDLGYSQYSQLRDLLNHMIKLELMPSDSYSLKGHYSGIGTDFMLVAPSEQQQLENFLAEAELALNAPLTPVKMARSDYLFLYQVLQASRLRPEDA